jgi:hypothetical protein
VKPFARHCLQLAVTLLPFVLPGFALSADARTPGRAAAPARSGPPRSVRPAVAPPVAPTQSPRPGAEARRLDDIHIEGEIAVPQVLFITARDQRHFMEFQNRRYLRSSSQLGEATMMPGWIIVTPTPIRTVKEIAR